MKRITFMLLAALVAVVSYAQAPAAKALKANAAQAVRAGFVTSPQVVAEQAPAASARSIDVNAVKTSNKVVRKAAEDYEIITEQPAGELKQYTRSGKYLYASSGRLYIGSQGGFADVVFADDNVVYLKDPVSYLPFGSWVKGTLSADGATITVPLGQNLYYNATYDACIALGAIQSYRSHDTSITEITYTIDGNTIALNGFTSYAETLGGYWTDDDSLQGYGDYATVYTLFEEPDVVTPPAGMEVKQYPVSGSENASTDYVSTVNVGWDGSDVYIQGLLKYVPDAWVKGTLEDGLITFQIQYVGKDEESPYFMSGYSSSGPVELTADYDDSEQTIAFNGSMMFNSSASELSYVIFYNGLLIGTPPSALELPEGLEPETRPIAGYYYASSWSQYVGTVQVAFDGNDVYVKDILPDVSNGGWVKGTIADGKAVFATGQYVGKDDTYGSNTYFVGYDSNAGELADAVFAVDGDYFVAQNYVFSNGKKTKLYYNGYFNTGMTIYPIVEPAKEELAALTEKAETYFNNENMTEGRDDFEAAITAAKEAQDYVDVADVKAAMEELQKAIDAFKAANGADVPAVPSINAVDEDETTGLPTVYFTVKTEDTKGNAIDADNLYYQFLVDVEKKVSPLVLSPDEYTSLEKEMSVIKYGFTDDYDVFEDFIYLEMDTEDWNRLGLKAIYEVNGEKVESDVAWFELKPYAAVDPVELCAITPAPGVYDVLPTEWVLTYGGEKLQVNEDAEVMLTNAAAGVEYPLFIMLDEDDDTKAIIAFDGKAITTPGEWVIEVPGNTITVAGQAIADPQSFKYTVKSPVDYTIDPAEGEVASLSTFTITFHNYMVEAKEDYITVYLFNRETEEVIDAKYADVIGGGKAIYIEFDEITEPGQWQLNVEDGFFKTNGDYVPELFFEYTVTGKTVGINQMNATAEGEVSYFDLQGRKADATAKGVLVKQIRTADGTVKTAKVVRK